MSVTLPPSMEILQRSLPTIPSLLPAPSTARPAAVLVVFTQPPSTATVEVLLIERPAHSRTHANQIAFPGGAVEHHDSHRIATALRETQEELGVLPESVQILGTLPEVWVHVSNFAVTPVIGYWSAPHPVTPNEHEVSRVLRVPVTELVDPTNHAQHQLSTGEAGPAFRVCGTEIWGFTAGVLHQLLPVLHHRAVQSHNVKNTQ